MNLKNFVHPTKYFHISQMSKWREKSYESSFCIVLLERRRAESIAAEEVSRVV